MSPFCAADIHTVYHISIIPSIDFCEKNAKNVLTVYKKSAMLLIYDNERIKTVATKRRVLTATIIFNVSPGLKQLAEQGAKQNGIPFSEYMRQLVSDGLKRDKVKLPENES